MVSRLSAQKRSASAYLASTQAIQGSSGILSSLIEICDPSSLQGRTTPRGPEFDVQEIAFEKESGRNIQQFCELQEARGADAAFANLAFSIFNKRQSERLRKGYFTDPKNFSSTLNLHANVFINGTQWCYSFSHKFPRRPEFLRPKQSTRISARNDAAPSVVLKPTSYSLSGQKSIALFYCLEERKVGPRTRIVDRNCRPFTKQKPCFDQRIT
jgi:hypothetical protein